MTEKRTDQTGQMARIDRIDQTDQTEQMESAEKDGAKGGGLKRLWGRLLLYLLLAVCVATMSVCYVGMQFLSDQDIFQVQDEAMDSEKEISDYVGRKLLYLYLYSGMDGVNAYCEETNILYALYTKAGRRVGGNMPLTSEKYSHIVECSPEEFKEPDSTLENIEDYRVFVNFKGKPDFWDFYGEYLHIARFVVAYRYVIPALFVGSSVLAAILFVLLVCTGKSRPCLRVLPPELVTAAAGYGIYYFWGRKIGNIDLRSLNLSGLDVGIILVAVIAAAYLAYLHAEIREEKWHHYTLCYQIFFLFKKLAGLWREVLREISLIRRLALAAAVVSALEFAALWLILPEGKSRWILAGLWLAEKLLLLPYLFRRAVNMSKIQTAVSELAAGNLTYQMEVAALPGAFRKFGSDLNAVAGSVSLAVEDRIKSERLKTELITNVSHDIKTPLTSIINFADLISREQTENPKITEYAGLLYKQSTRLKKLIEDLIEASKASTGNLEMNIEPCEVRTLLAQCLGEYEKRLKELAIDLIVKLSPDPVWIMADSKMLWRIFENLMSNICKYSQKETRVYLTMEQWGDRVFITFKNISKYPLDVSPEDLTERFVRGDLSRHTEGNGLGLSIVKSLMDLHNGKIELAVDGDLFKAILEFPVAERAEPAVVEE